MKKQRYMIGLAAAFFLAFFLPIFYDPNAIHLETIHQSPSWIHFFGTDHLGRDLFVRCFAGLKVSCFIGLLAMGIDLVIALPYGALAALYEKKFGFFLTQIADILYTIPTVLMILLCISVFGPGLFPIVIAFFLSSWVTTARVFKRHVLLLKKQPFVLVARQMGGSSLHLFFWHLLNNSWRQIASMLCASVPKAIFMEAFLSFLGLGVSPPYSSLGALIAEGVASMEFFPWLAIFPSILLSFVLFCCYQISTDLQESLA